MTTLETRHSDSQGSLRLDESLPLAGAASGIGAFELDFASGQWAWTPQVAALFGRDPQALPATFEDSLRTVFADDAPKILGALEAAKASGSYYVEFRVKQPDGRLHWLAGKGQVEKQDGSGAQVLRGTYYEIGERKQLEAKLLAVNETLEARVSELREEARALEVLNRTGVAIGAELDLERLVQIVTDAGTELSGAQFGAFFYNVLRPDGEAYTLYTLSGAPREAFANFPMPRNTAVFEPTFRGTGTLRSPDILADPRYGKSEPYHGMPPGHLPVRSYLAVPVLSRTGEVLGGLFFGHAQPGMFSERAERILVGLAAQAAVAIDNSRLYQTSVQEVAARRQAEERLQELNRTLEERVAERAQQLAASTVKLEDIERRFRILVEGVTDYAIYMLDPERRDRQLESRRGAHQGVRTRGDYRSAFFAVLHRGGQAGGDSAQSARHRNRHRKIRGGRLARAKGRQPVLGWRRDQCDQGCERRDRRICQDHA